MSATCYWLAASICLGLPGAPVADFGLRDLQGNPRRLDDWRASRLVAVVFLRPGCPLAERYGPTLAGLADEFEARGVGFVGVVPGGGEEPAEVARFAASRGLRFPILLDPDAEVADRLGARRTPEVVVLDERRLIRYRGRVDGRQSLAPAGGGGGRRDLAVALGEILGGRAVSRPEAEAAGCPIGRPAAAPGPARATYGRDVAPILHRRCVGCHRAGQIGPFSLTDYAKASGRARAIAEAVEDGRMPPWHADPRHGRFANDPRLTESEKRLIAGWADAGAPEGDPADRPPSVDDPGGWRLAAPDLVVSMPGAFAVPASGSVDYQVFEVDPGFDEDRWVRSAEIRPRNRRVVHHCNVFLKAPGSRNEADAVGDLGSFCLAATTPGTSPASFPDGMAKRVPAGWRLVFVVHYEPTGRPETDRTSIGLRFADPKAVRKEVATGVLIDPALRIPPRAADHRVERSRRFDEDVLLLALFPHMHLRGRSFRYEAVHPDGRVEVLLDVPRYDFRWQNRYELAEPRRLPAGTTLRAIAHYDNSGGNPANPDPDAVVLAGPQSRDEMFNGYYDFALADRDLTRPPMPAEVWRAASRHGGAALALALGFAACSAAALLLIRRALPASGGRAIVVGPGTGEDLDPQESP